jgi:integrative and conjugative element protein (TIGR02256 family)
MDWLQPHSSPQVHGAPVTEFVWLPVSLLSALADEAQLHEPEETGGILVGHYTMAKSNGKRDAVITDVIGPGPEATRSRVSFEPDSAWQASELARIYAERDRRVSYLGDWHTHPTAQPNPSVRDLKTLEAIAAYSPARCPEPIMAILGKEAPGQNWEVAVYQHVARRQVRQIAARIMP